MNKLRLLKSGYGDECLCEWDATPELIDRARVIFDRAMTPGRLAFALESPGQHRLLTQFDPNVGDLVIIPQIIGG
jgi:hypothetical protein